MFSANLKSLLNVEENVKLAKHILQKKLKVQMQIRENVTVIEIDGV